MRKKENNNIRVWADCTTGFLNECLLPWIYPLPYIEEIFSFFFLNWPDNRILTDWKRWKILKKSVNNTNKGLSSFNRLPFGIEVATSNFQEGTDTTVVGSDFNVPYLDDLLKKRNKKPTYRKHTASISVNKELLVQSQ